MNTDKHIKRTQVKATSKVDRFRGRFVATATVVIGSQEDVIKSQGDTESWATFNMSSRLLDYRAALLSVGVYLSDMEELTEIIKEGQGR